ncbi:hypothetical protein KBH77_03935 [Patescibacteria group bacterium]|nr:hypothetical protein [Patescibacteria group bacterium]
MSKYDVDDAARDTDSSSSKTSEAWHDARDDAERSGDLPERGWNKLDDSPIKDFFCDTLGWKK